MGEVSGHDRAEPVAGDAPERLEVVAVVAVITIVAVLVAAVPLLLLDPGANDGAGPIAAIVGVPALATSIVIEVVMRANQAKRPMTPKMLWWVLVVLPVGVLLCAIPAILADPEYFESETVGGAVGTLALMLVLAYVGILFGALLWFFVVFPLAGLVMALIARARGDKEGGRIGFGHFFMLGLTAVILIAALSLDFARAGRLAWGSIIAAVLGLPGAYEVVWPPGLWIVRAAIVVFVAFLCWPALSRRMRGR